MRRKRERKQSQSCFEYVSLYQFCDIVDPLIRRDLAAECENPPQSFNFYCQLEVHMVYKYIRNIFLQANLDIKVQLHVCMNLETVTILFFFLFCAVQT